MILSSESEVVMVGLPFVPLFFRGFPKEQCQGDLLKHILANTPLAMDQGLKLPNSKLREYRPNMTDSAVWDLYSRRATTEIGVKFARVIPVIPFSSEMVGDASRTLRFLADRLPTVIDSNPLSAKQILFLESRDDYSLLCNACPVHASSDVCLRQTRMGLLYAIPLFVSEEEGEHGFAMDCPRLPRARAVQGAVSAFLRQANSQLRLIHPALSR